MAAGALRPGGRLRERQGGGSGGRTGKPEGAVYPSTRRSHAQVTAEVRVLTSGWAGVLLLLGQDTRGGRASALRTAMGL